MVSEIHFKGMVRSEALEEFALQRVESVLSEFLHRHDWHARVWLVTEHSRRSNGVPLFQCEIDVRFPHRKEIFIKKSNIDMYQAFGSALDSLKIAVRDYSKREIDNKKSVGAKLNLRPITVTV